ncbi:transcriptional regulator, GntR family [Jatrophihabitans endophyticus]|uniref:Transcriptional regulator, GntR family n=1 Tax=Jatrophihabitans endophyticus TaxID=1206085 RepID=A0A1M5PQB1_9ACTN|nr:GntR family transcriptional regulator [Jatrophihabitans endophyticus]SHH03954.1 transcriptional regulator, GntR family [Jatrophihabitans endophyticus]
MNVDGDIPRRVRVQPRIAESIAAELRERILNGTYSGLLPKQEALVAMFGVSAPPLREALRILEMEGLITVRRGKVGGAVIHLPDGGSVSHAIGMTLQAERVHLRDVGELLANLEPQCAASCAGHPATRAALATQFEENLARAAASLGNGPAFTHWSRQFHDLVVASTPQATTRLVVRSLVAVWSAQEETWAHEAAEVGQYPTDSEQRTVLNAHRRIADRILSGDAAAAERAARSHLIATQKRVVAEFGDRVVDASSPRAVRGLRDVTARRSGNGRMVDHPDAAPSIARLATL